MLLDVIILMNTRAFVKINATSLTRDPISPK
jgi:hypothetical protein